MLQSVYNTDNNKVTILKYVDGCIIFVFNSVFLSVLYKGFYGNTISIVHFRYSTNSK